MDDHAAGVLGALVLAVIAIVVVLGTVIGAVGNAGYQNQINIQIKEFGDSYPLVGKQYISAALNRNPIKGMPVKLLSIFWDGTIRKLPIVGSGIEEWELTDTGSRNQLRKDQRPVWVKDEVIVSHPPQYQYQLDIVGIKVTRNDEEISITPLGRGHFLFEDSAIAQELVLKSIALGVSITNKSDVPMQVLWDQWALVDFSGNTYRLYPSVTRCIQENQSVHPAFLPSQANIKEGLVVIDDCKPQKLWAITLEQSNRKLLFFDTKSNPGTTITMTERYAEEVDFRGTSVIVETYQTDAELLRYSIALDFSLRPIKN